ncbi:MAG TPA: hypothetical protein DHV08_14035 [Rhodocyclaceae bacterium]|nr:MAG: hypothetical protein AUK49_06555 [Betaproteobacteria bacterium CG2_30_68_42]PIV72109.1 MAG: hypothetical protein COW56_11045 [Rhodocyclales bacterium CG17_big_fil_post_rev_8_21_14_2_50_68_7]PJA57203.1 MAG: hypothetical protein CO164_09100 [Rhodocyclales bacterium CG_4_9_14_3_um_filter_68_10]HCX34544.1 hypothetical protein [Rhodocyclaceae bacterium]
MIARGSLTAQRLAGVFLLGWALFNYPFLYLFNRAETVAGIPMLYAYVFAVWAALIGMMAWVIERRRDKP